MVEKVLLYFLASNVLYLPTVLILSEELCLRSAVSLLAHAIFESICLLVDWEYFA